ncbi:ABC transporter permease [Leucobacter sp. CSA1]|uniref:ABC transporter permease n=1 Tax=Leucobacter chromiisoli TaxID=2796471 RepID=A0A934Q5L7_9MICO|nr:ABC transporter permease [Leucobacter chromiisoli]MBK0418088.1 ABC transporter permease [Leucobacter chromiisoli]
MDIIDAFLSSGIRFITPILLAALGCLLTEWTKDLNVGLEGAMLFGAFFGVVIGLGTGNAALAVILTLLLGAIAGAIFGILVSVFRVNVFVAGIVLNIFAAGATVYLLRSMYGVKGTLSDTAIPKLPKIVIPGLDDVPVLGALLSGHTILTYLSWIIVIGLALAARYTVVARHLKAAGEHPEALAAAGGNVTLMRVLAQVWCFAMCALAGVQLSMGQLSLFTEGMTSGLGFVALAAVIFCRGRVGLLTLMCVLFGLATAVSILVDASVMPPQFGQMLPYIVAFVGLVVLARTSKSGGMRIATPKLEEA